MKSKYTAKPLRLFVHLTELASPWKSPITKPKKQVMERSLANTKLAKITDISH